MMRFRVFMLNQRSGRVAAALAGAALLATGASLVAQQPAGTAKPDDQNAAPAAHGEQKRNPIINDPELRKKAREMLSKRLEARQREIDSLKKAIDLFDQGKSFEELRTLLPDLPRFGQRGDEREQWQRRMEQWGGGWGGNGPGGDDVNRLGGPGGGMPAPGPNAGPGNKPPEAPHVLTEEDRTTVRDVLAATAPDTLKRLRELETSEPAKADQQYARSLERMRSLIDLRKRDRAMFDLKAKDIRCGFEAGNLARAIGEIDKQSSPDTAARQQKVEQLRTALLEQYNVRTQIMQRDVDHSAERAAEMAKEIQARPAKAAEVVDKNVKDMLDRERRRRERGPDGNRGDRHSPDGKPAEPAANKQ